MACSASQIGCWLAGLLPPSPDLLHWNYLISLHLEKKARRTWSFSTHAVQERERRQTAASEACLFNEWLHATGKELQLSILLMAYDGNPYVLYLQFGT